MHGNLERPVQAQSQSGYAQVIGTSESYTTEAARENGIKSVMKNAPEASVDDMTG